MPLNKDSLANTFLIATLLCLGCGVLVSAAAVLLKPLQSANALNDRRVNILKVSGFSDEDIAEAGGVNELFEGRFKTTIIDLETGKVAVEECEAALNEAGKVVDEVVKNFDQIWCSKSKKGPVADKLDKKQDIAGIKYREKFSHVFTLTSSDGKIEKYVFPVRGYGLWSMMQGYMAVEPDLKTVAGLTFYEQGETPGLGGEIMNPRWKAKWEGKKIFDGNQVALKVSKGDQSEKPYGVDALSGATITSNGVTNMVKFWMGDNGFGPYIAQQKSGDSASSSDANQSEKDVDPKTASTTGDAIHRPAKSGINHG
jgi:Na+-transporting NADH:ubiquinone oxidoreductase subunit C